ncbi:MAG: TRAP transporter substrate-binding protein [Betaproteobacteria bacterium]
MKRRSFLKKASLGLAAGAIATPAIAQSGPTIKWRMASSFPKSLDTIYGGGEVVAKRVAEATGGKFQIQVFAAGEIVPGSGVLDVIKDGTVECGHTCGYYFYGKDPTFCIDTSIPFGMTNRQTDAWFRHGNGSKLLGDFFAKSNILAIPAGNTGVQMGGWYRKEIKSVGDLKGLRMRIAGLAGTVLSKLGVISQQLSGADIYPALEKGTIDAAEWVGPYDDQKLGLYKVAKYYYYPAWWEGGTQISLYINLKEWEKLPKEYQTILRIACADAHMDMLAKYDSRNPAALNEIISSGTHFRQFPKDVMEASYLAAQEVYSEIMARNPEFKKVFMDYVQFRDMENAWFRHAEGTFSNYMYSKIMTKK